MNQHHRKASTILAILAVVFLASTSCSNKPKSLDQKKHLMLENQLKRRGIKDEKLLGAFKNVPRENFVMPQYREQAYDDVEVPMAPGETLNRPFEDAIIIGALDVDGDDKLLEIGTGTGYLTSLLSNIAAEVYTIEIEPKYAKMAEKNFHDLKRSNVRLKVGDGFMGWKEYAPFDKIVLNCSPPHIPEPLKEQLAEGGLLLLPLGGGEKFQELILHKKKDGELFEIRKLAPTSFTPMKGKILEKTDH